MLDPKKRWNNGRGYSAQPLFSRAINKYGWESFEHVVLCEVSSREDANFLEQWFIDKFDTCNPEHGYNIARGGGGVIGVTWDEERRRKRSKELTGSGNPMFGRHHSKEAIARMSANRKGKRVSPEMRKLKTEILLKANKKRQVSIRQLDLDGSVVATYPSLAEAERQTGFNHSQICMACKGKRDFAYGHRWEYVDDEMRRQADEVRKTRPSNSQPIDQLDMDGNLVARFASMTEAHNKTGLNRNKMADCCKGLRQSYKDYQWRYSVPEDD